MNGPFVRNRRTSHASPRFRSPAFRTIPVQNQSSPVQKSDQKVVHIPIHFVGSEKMRSAAAVTIQKVFKGFLVRKILKRIFAIRSEVDEMQRRFLDRSVLQSIRRDPKERLRVNERLMAILFQLDSIPGVDAGIKSCRKSVIKNAIALQDLVDVSKNEDHKAEEKDASGNCEGIPLSSDSSLETPGNVQRATVQSYECSSSLDPTANYVETITEPAVDEIASNSLGSKENHDMQELIDLVEIPDSNNKDKTIPVVCGTEKHIIDPSISVDDSKEKGLDVSKSVQLESCRGGDAIVKNAGRDDVTEKMIKDNEILMNLVRDLCVKNDVQTKMLTALFRRVESLEKVLMMRKKKRVSGGTADGAAKKKQ